MNGNSTDQELKDRITKAHYMCWLLTKQDWIQEDPALEPVRNNKQFLAWANKLRRVLGES